MAVPRSGVPHGSFGGGPGSLEPQQKLRNTAVLDGTAGTDEGHTCLSQGMSSIAIDQSWTASQDSSLADEDQASEPETNQIVDIPLRVKRKRGRPPGKVKDGGRPPELTSGKKVSKEEKASEFLKCKQCSGLPFRPKAAAGLVIHMNNRPPGAKLTADTVKQLSQLHRAACIHCGSIRKAFTPTCYKCGFLTRTRKVIISDAIPDHRDVAEGSAAPPRLGGRRARSSITGATIRGRGPGP